MPRNPIANFYLHHFLRSDDDRALHDHPWYFLSFILKGSYYEYRKGGVKLYRKPLSFAVRRANTAHRVELLPPFNGHCSSADLGPEIPVWTIFMTGPVIRKWGFHCPKGWISQERFDYQNGCE